MENAGAMGLVLWAFIFIFIIAIAFLILAITLMIKGKGKEKKTYKIGSRICLILSIVCFVPILLVGSYCLYILIKI